MLIFLYGPDDYRREQKKKEFIAEFKKKRSGLGLAFFDFETKDGLAAFEEFVANQSIFESAKLAVIYNAFEIEAKALAKMLSPFLTHKTITVLLAEREKPVKALGFLLEKPSFSQKFEALLGSSWTDFISAESKKLDLTLSPSATQFLGTVYQGNSWALVTELQKIASFKTMIDKKDLDGFDLEAAPNYWALITNLKSADIRMRLGTLEKMLALGDPPAKIFNILASQLQEKIPRVAEYDFMVKSGKLDYEEVLVDLLIA